MTRLHELETPVRITFMIPAKNPDLGAASLNRWALQFWQVENTFLFLFFQSHQSCFYRKGLRDDAWSDIIPGAMFLP